MNTTVKKPVGVVGLGAMGMGVAMSLLREGFEVHACDVRPEAVQKVVDAGFLQRARECNTGKTGANDKYAGKGFHTVHYTNAHNFLQRIR